MVEKNKKMKVLRMKFSIVEIVPTSDDDDVFKLSPASQLPYWAKIKKMGQKSNNKNIPLFSLLDRFGAILY